MIYGSWAVWLVAVAVLKIMGLCSWWWALSPLWMPVLTIVGCGAIFLLISDVGVLLKSRRESKIHPSCENCLFRRAVEMINETRAEGEKTTCIGEKMGSPHGQVCQYWQKS